MGNYLGKKNREKSMTNYNEDPEYDQDELNDEILEEVIDDELDVELDDFDEM